MMQIQRMLLIAGRFDMVIVVCFVGGMLYYSMNVLWPRQSQAFFIPEDAVIMRGVYAMIFSCGTWCTYRQEPLRFDAQLTTSCSGRLSYRVRLLAPPS